LSTIDKLLVDKRASADEDQGVTGSSASGTRPGAGPDRLAAEIADELAELERRGLRRALRPLASPSDPEVSVEGRRVLLLSSNNYLGLATHPAVEAAACEAIRRWGCGAGASRLIAGHLELHAMVEAALAAFKGTEAALLFPSGYQANVGAITALAGPGDHVFSDALNHASIIDGCRLSRARVHVFPHRDVEALEQLLAATPPGGRRLVVTDAVFSMDGDRAPLADLVALAQRYRAYLVLDEAHAAGVLGPRGAGLADACGLSGEIAVQVGTLGKAFGSAGAYVAGSKALIELLVNRARSFIYTTALPPAAVAAAGAALEIVRTEPERRARVLAHAARLRTGFRALGLDTGGDTHIVPVLLGDNARALAFSRALLERGVLVQAIRPPTVPAGTARLRVTPMATHDDAQLAYVLEAFAEARQAVGGGE